MQRLMTLDQAQALPVWRRPLSLLFLMAFAMPLAFSTWSALLNNFVIEAAGFTGVEIGWLHSVREIPGFLAIGVIAIIMFMREQVLGLVALFSPLQCCPGWKQKKVLQTTADNNKKTISIEGSKTSPQVYCVCEVPQTSCKC